MTYFVQSCVLVAIEIFCFAITYLLGYFLRDVNSDMADIFRTAWASAVAIAGIAVLLALIERGIV